MNHLSHCAQGVDVTTRVDLELHAALRKRAREDGVSKEVVQRRAMARYVWPVDHVDRVGHWPADTMRGADW